ncbi:MAG: type II secretion system protein [bacterium]|nr:type II secretion system protein [bacterium]
MKGHSRPLRGFTLIELLVVIAIIGILSAVVLASLNTARTKGNDAGVKANLSTVGTQAALYLSDNSNSYGTFAVANCPASGVAGATVFHDPTIEKAVASALVDSGGGTAKCVSNSTDYAVAVSRPDTTNSTYWCVDSTGAHCGINTLITTPTCGTTCVSQ